MRVAAIYDIHGNLPALEAVLQEIEQARVDQLVVGGDVVAGPMPGETLDRLLNLDMPVQFIKGNADREIVAQMAGENVGAVPDEVLEIIRWVAEQLSPEQGQLLAEWPLTYQAKVEGIGQVLFCHATPRNDTDVFTRLTPEERLLPIFAGVQADLVVCGHTHMQFDRMVGQVRVVNAGSVGMPYGDPGACWLLLGTGIELRRTEYDGEAAAATIRATHYPQAKNFAAHNILQVPSEAEALELFTQMEMK